MIGKPKKDALLLNNNIIGMLNKHSNITEITTNFC